MGALLKLIPNHATPMSDLPATLGADAWAAAPEDRRRTAELRAAVVAPLAALVREGASISNTARLFLARAQAELLDPNTAHVLAALSADGADSGTSFSTLKRWITDYLAHGKAGLLPRHTGRVRKDYGWEARAIALYNIPGKPGFADVAWTLRNEGHASATESRVKRYLKSLPATLGAHSPARVGEHLHRLTRRHYQRRHVNDILPGEVYVGDGHTIDCYLAHPNTGKPYRAELTMFIDLKSRRPVGWWFTESESAVSTLYALSHGMRAWNHVPAWVYIDRGAGYRARMLADECTGWYAKWDIQVMGALPGNPHGKGWIERFFRTVRDKHDKFFYGGQVYCGDDMAPEVNRRLSAELAQGKRTLPTVAEYVASFAAWVEHYAQEPMDVLGGRTPNQVWAELTPVTLGDSADAVMRPSEVRTVRRQAVTLHGRAYWHEALALYDEHKVEVEYDLHDDRIVWVRDTKGRHICEARLAHKISVLPASRIEEARDKRLQGQLKRLQRHADEAASRREDAITAADQLRAIEQLERPTLPAPANPVAAPAHTDHPDTPAHPADPSAPDDGQVIDIDILSWRTEE